MPLTIIVGYALCLRQIMSETNYGNARDRCLQFKNTENSKSQVHRVDGFVHENGRCTISQMSFN